MFDVKKLLVTVDFTNLTPHVLDCAAELAQATKARVHLLHVVPISNAVIASEGAATAVARSPEADAADESRVQTMVTELEQRGVEAEGAVATGTVKESILSAARAIDADAMVMGSHGKGLLERALLGSTCRAVLSDATIPVVLVPPPRTEEGSA